MTKNALLVVLMAACGPNIPPQLPNAPPVVKLHGDYVAALRPITTEGTCGFIGKEAFGGVGFDEAGNLAPNFPGVSCETTYPNGLVALECKGYGNTLTAQADHVHVQDGGVTQTQGLGEAHGNVGGCKAVTFAFRFWVKQ